MSSIKVSTAVSVYGEFAQKPKNELTVEDVVKGVVRGRHSQGEMVDRVVCYRSAFDPGEIHLAYCQGDAAAVRVLASRDTKEARVVYKDGSFTDGNLNRNHGIPSYLRDAVRAAVAGE